MNQLLRLTPLVLSCWLLSAPATGLSLHTGPASVPNARQSAERSKMTADAMPHDPILLREGTVITLELYETVSSKNRRAGDLVEMGVYKAYITEGQTLIRENAYAEGKVVLAQRKGVFGRPGRIVVSAVNVEAVDNQRVALVGQQIDPPGESRRMLAWGGSVILTLVGIIVLVATGGPPALALPLLLFGLLVSGKEVEIPVKMKVQAIVKYDVRIQP